MTITTANGKLHGKGVTTTPAAPGFGKALRRYRQRARLSQSKLGRYAGCDHATIARLESGARNPSRRMIDTLADALRLDTTDAARLYVAAQMLPPGVDADAVVALVEAGR